MDQQNGGDSFFQDLTNSGHKLRPRTPEGKAHLTKRQSGLSKDSVGGMVTGRVTGSGGKFLATAADKDAFVPLVVGVEREEKKENGRVPRSQRVNRRQVPVTVGGRPARLQNAVQHLLPGAPAQIGLVKERDNVPQQQEEMQGGGEGDVQIKAENGVEVAMIEGAVEEEDQLCVAIRELKQLDKKVELAKQQRKHFDLRVQRFTAKRTAKKKEVAALVKASGFL